MKCQQCGVNRANIAMAMQFNNEKMQVHLCNECFQKIQGQFTDPSNFQQGSNMFSHPFFQGNVGGQGQSRTTTHQQNAKRGGGLLDELGTNVTDARSEEHTSELQSRGHLVCRLLLEKKKHL